MKSPASFSGTVSPTIEEKWKSTIEDKSNTVENLKIQRNNDLEGVKFLRQSSGSSVKNLLGRYSGKGGPVETEDQFRLRKLHEDQYDKQRKLEAKMDLMSPLSRQRAALVLQKFWARVKGRGPAEKKNFLLMFGKMQICYGFRATAFSYRHYLSSLIQDKQQDWEQEWPEWEQAINEITEIDNILEAELDISVFQLTEELDPEDKQLLDSIQNADKSGLGSQKWESFQSENSGSVKGQSSFLTELYEKEQEYRLKQLEAKFLLMSGGDTERAAELLKKFLDRARAGGIVEKKSFLVMFSRFQHVFGKNVVPSELKHKNGSVSVPSLMEIVTGDMLCSSGSAEWEVWEKAVHEVVETEDIWNAKFDIPSFDTNEGLSSEDIQLLNYIQDPEIVFCDEKSFTSLDTSNTFSDLQLKLDFAPVAQIVNAKAEKAIQPRSRNILRTIFFCFWVALLLLVFWLRRASLHREVSKHQVAKSIPTPTKRQFGVKRFLENSINYLTEKMAFEGVCPTFSWKTIIEFKECSPHI